MAKRKIVVETDNSSWQAPKKRKKRKPMTEDQRQASAKHLEKARAVRAKKNSNYGQSGIHPTLRNLSEDHPAHPNKVKKWIKTQKEFASTERKAVREKVKGEFEVRKLYYRNPDPVKKKPLKILILKAVEPAWKIFFTSNYSPNHCAGSVTTT